MTKFTAISLLLLLAVTFPSYAYECKALQTKYKLSATQVHNMWKSYEYAKEKNLGYTLAAISYKESSAGIFNINRKDPSAGHHHVLVTHVLKYFNLKDTEANREKALKVLKENFEVSAFFALTELEWWLNRHNGDWFKTLRSYNQGYYWKIPNPEARKRSWNYATEAKALVSFMQQHCNWHKYNETN